MGTKNDLKKVLPIVLAASGVLAGAAEGEVKLWSRTFQAEKCKVDAAQVEIVEQKGFRQNKGVALKKSAVDRSNFGKEGGKADLTITVNIPKDGHYILSSIACVDGVGTKLMKKAKTKYESLWVKLQIPGTRTTRRVAYEPWRLPKIFTNELGIFQIAAGKQTIKIDIPRGLRLDQITISDYVPPEIPKGAENYNLPFSVPKRHPRLLINPAELARIRSQIMHPDNTEMWAKVRKTAETPYKFDVDMSREVGYNGELLKVIRQKALYSLVSGSEAAGREAVDLTKKYITCVEYGNLLDISRENGETIFTASIVYDWCHNLLSAEDKELFYKELMRLALIMECGYPPFKQQITTGHGSEAMMNRDMLIKLRSIARRAGYYERAKDDFGRVVETYAGVPMVDMGKYYNGEQTVDVVATNGGKTAIYAVSLGLDGFHGISPTGTGVITSYMPDLSTPGAVKTGEVELVAGVALKNTLKAAVLKDIAIGA